MTRVMLVPNGLYEDSMADASMIEDWLADEGVDVVRAPGFGLDAPADLEGVGLVVSLGGDGTLLRAAHIVGGRGIPILGLSYGHLGFLTCDQDGLDARAMVAAALAQELHATRRAAIEVRLEGTGADGRPQRRVERVLNEVVLARGASGKMVEFDVEANGVHVDRLRGDGFVVATATGSTGYALSAGGPIVAPDFKGLVCVPIAPHTITARAFLTSPSDVVRLTVVRDRSSDPCVFADGEPLFPDVAPETIEAARSPDDVVLLTRGQDGFFESVSRVFYGKVR